MSRSRSFTRMRYKIFVLNHVLGGYVEAAARFAMYKELQLLNCLKALILIKEKLPKTVKKRTR